MNSCACCGRGLTPGEADLARPFGDWRCNRCWLGECGCRLTLAEQQDADRRIDRLATEGARMERDARPWRDDDENTEEVRNVL